MNTIEIQGEQIEVKPLVWRDSLSAVRRVADSVGGLIAKDGKFIFDKDKILQALTSQEDNVAFLIGRSTGRPKEWIDSLTARDVFVLLDRIVEINLTPDLITGIAGLGSRLVTTMKRQTAEQN